MPSNHLNAIAPLLPCCITAVLTALLPVCASATEQPLGTQVAPADGFYLEACPPSLVVNATPLVAPAQWSPVSFSVTHKLLRVSFRSFNPSSNLEKPMVPEVEYTSGSTNNEITPHVIKDKSARRISTYTVENPDDLQQVCVYEDTAAQLVRPVPRVTQNGLPSLGSPSLENPALPATSLRLAPEVKGSSRPAQRCEIVDYLSVPAGSKKPVHSTVFCR
jgi:hypothetical protein